MTSPTVSVIIPTYNGAVFLGDAIQSVLDQSYTNIELVVVNDASPDHTSEVVKRFDDNRLQYIVHEENQGAVIARNNGVYASCGEIIAFLDQDDFFHPKKIEKHVTYLQKHPEVGLSYNSRFELHRSSKTIREIRRPPEVISLKDLVLGFPIAPSDLMLRRDWALQMIDLRGNNRLFHGGEILSHSRLLLAGCKFGFINSALNYRRYHKERIFKDLSANCREYLTAQEKIFADPECPSEVSAMRDIAYANSYVVWASHALAQEETDLGLEFLRKAIHRNPSLLVGRPCELVNHLISFSVDADSQDHEQLLKRMFNQMPTEFVLLIKQLDWAIAYGYLIKGAQAIIWEDSKDGKAYFTRAAELGAEINADTVQRLAYHLVNYEAEFGIDATNEVIHNLALYLAEVDKQKSVRLLKSIVLINHAFNNYRAGNYAEVPGTVLSAIANNPKYLFNRGVLSILIRSLIDTHHFIWL